ncbi:MAG: anti-sigma factor antagonist [Clostridia bacterium]|nr:anti-sigma factor antagonist [Clostridia bacterium]
MRIISTKDANVLSISLEGELDHHSAKGAISQIANIIEIELPLNVTLNLKGLSFMDSSGIALVLHTWRRLNDFSAKLKIENVPTQGYKVLNAAGIPRLIPTTRLH